MIVENETRWNTEQLSALVARVSANCGATTPDIIFFATNRCANREPFAIYNGWCSLQGVRVVVIRSPARAAKGKSSMEIISMLTQERHLSIDDLRLLAWAIEGALTNQRRTSFAFRNRQYHNNGGPVDCSVDLTDYCYVDDLSLTAGKRANVPIVVLDAKIEQTKKYIERKQRAFEETMRTHYLKLENLEKAKAKAQRKGKS